MRASRHRKSGTPVSPLSASETPGVCALCERPVSTLTRHHLRPRAEGGLETAPFCPPCHRQVHALFTNGTLAAEFDSLEKLRAAPEVRGYLAWVRRRPDSHVQVRKSRFRR